MLTDFYHQIFKCFGVEKNIPSMQLHSGLMYYYIYHDALIKSVIENVYPPGVAPNSLKLPESFKHKRHNFNKIQEDMKLLRVNFFMNFFYLLFKSDIVKLEDPEANYKDWKLLYIKKLKQMQ